MGRLEDELDIPGSLFQVQLNLAHLGTSVNTDALFEIRRARLTDISPSKLLWSLPVITTAFAGHDPNEAV